MRLLPTHLVAFPGRLLLCCTCPHCLSPPNATLPPFQPSPPCAGHCGAGGCVCPLQPLAVANALVWLSLRLRRRGLCHRRLGQRRGEPWGWGLGAALKYCPDSSEGGQHHPSAINMCHHARGSVPASALPSSVGQPPIHPPRDAVCPASLQPYLPAHSLPTPLPCHPSAPPSCSWLCAMWSRTPSWWPAAGGGRWSPSLCGW